MTFADNVECMYLLFQFVYLVLCTFPVPKQHHLNYSLFIDDHQPDIHKGSDINRYVRENRTR